MAQRSRRRRVAEKREIFSQWAEEEGVSVSALLGYLLYLENWNLDKHLANVGWRIFMKEEEVIGLPRVTIEEAIWLLERSFMSQAVYLELRLRFKDRIFFPAVMNIRAENKRHRPILEEYKHGVRAHLMECLSLTLSERLKFLDLSGLAQDSIQVFFKMSWGLDGSGDHADYHQLSKVSYNTKAVMSVCFALREVRVVDGRNESVSWSSKVDGANRPQNTRPLAVFPSQESKESEFIPLVEAEVKTVEELGVEVKAEDDCIQTVATCEKCSMSMIDGKMVTTLLNLGGAFCTMCSKSQKDCHNPDVIEAGFVIERDVQGIRDLALSLTDEDTGEIKKKKGDYQTRQGVCGVPITESDLTKSFPVCHSKIRSFQWVVELLTRLKSHKKWATPTNCVRYEKEETEDYKKMWEELKELIYQNLAINIGNPGDMVTGKAFVNFASDSSRAFFVSLVDEMEKEDLDIILLGLCAVVKVINSQKRKVNVEKLRILAQEVNMKIVTTFPWAAISPSVHRILAHSWEVIEMNDGFGLGDVSEEGLEALNKLIRQMRTHGARKNSTVNNFQVIGFRNVEIYTFACPL